MSGRDIFDVSATEKKILEARHARRTVLRHEYLKQIHNPYRMATGEGGSVFDSGIQRFMAMKATQGAFFRPNPKGSLMYLGVIVVPISLALFVIIRAKDAEERLYRTGQVSYRDREFKFT